MNATLITILSVAFGSLVGGGAAYFSIRSRNKKTRSEAGRTDSESTRIIVGAAGELVSDLRNEIERLNARIEQLTEKDRLREEEVRHLRAEIEQANALRAQLAELNSTLITVDRDRERLRQENQRLRSSLRRKGAPE